MRRPAFLGALAFMIDSAYVYLPHAGSGYLTVDIHGHRPRYNSAGVGGMLALLANTFIGLAGFYLVRGAIQRDRETGVGAVLAATPLTRLAYLLSKLLSGFAVLASMMAMLWLAGGVLQLLLGEDRRLDLVALLQPLLVFCLPAMLMVAAVAVAFDSWPLFRGGLGNVAYFILWMGSLARAGLTTHQVSPPRIRTRANANHRQPSSPVRAGCAWNPCSDQSVSGGLPRVRQGAAHLAEADRLVRHAAHGANAASRLAWISFPVPWSRRASLVFDRFAEAPAPARRAPRAHAGRGRRGRCRDGCARTPAERHRASRLPARRPVAAAVHRRMGAVAGGRPMGRGSWWRSAW
jgi:hypothetical protein